MLSLRKATYLNTTVAVLLLACSEKKPEVPPSAQKAPAEATGDIVVGQVGSMTGAMATFGRSSRDGVELAIKKINATGGLRGRKIKLIHYDDGGLPENATQ